MECEIIGGVNSDVVRARNSTINCSSSKESNSQVKNIHLTDILNLSNSEIYNNNNLTTSTEPKSNNQHERHLSEGETSHIVQNVEKDIKVVFYQANEDTTMRKGNKT